MTGTELKEIRKDLGHTQDSLAGVLGTTSTTVARWERGEVTIPNYLGLALKQIQKEMPKKVTKAGRPAKTKDDKK